MESETIVIPPEAIEVETLSEYQSDLSEHFNELPKVANSLLNEANNLFSKIESLLYTTPSLINAVKSAFPDTMIQAVLTNEQKEKIAKGVLELMTKKDGTLLATLVDPKTKKVIHQIPLETVKVGPEISQAMTNFSMQMQMAQIAQQIQVVQHAIEEVRRGQEFDRLATAYSCQQKLLQALEIKSPSLKEHALMQLVSSAEDSRNLLMLSQKSNIEFIKKQPESSFKKFFSSISTEENDKRISDIRESLSAVNMVSFVQAMAYQNLGEYEAARMSLTYYAEFIKDTYTSNPDLLDRLDMVDPSTENYWTKSLPVIEEKIQKLPYGASVLEIKKIKGRQKKNDKRKCKANL